MRAIIGWFIFYSSYLELMLLRIRLYSRTWS
jgi:hypothetical protein